MFNKKILLNLLALSCLASSGVSGKENIKNSTPTQGISNVSNVDKLIIK